MTNSPSKGKPRSELHRLQVLYQSTDERDLEIYKAMVDPDPRGKAFTYTPSNLQGHLDLLPVSSKVPPEVLKLIDVAGELFMYSYLNYDFFYVSCQQSYLSIEAALKMRLGYIDHRRYPVKSKYTLRNLMTDALEKNYLPNRYRDLKDTLVSLRNMAFHPHQQTVLNAALAITPYLRLVDIANCLFDEECRELEPEVFVREREYYGQLVRDFQEHEKARGRAADSASRNGVDPGPE